MSTVDARAALRFINTVAEAMAYRPRPPLVGLPIFFAIWEPAEGVFVVWHADARTWFEVLDGPMPSLAEARAERAAALALARSFGRAHAFSDGDGRPFTLFVGDAILGRYDPMAVMLRADLARPPGQQKGPPLAALVAMHAALAAEGVSTPDPLAFLAAEDSDAPVEFFAIDAMTAPPPETAWFIPGIIPARELTLLSGDGGVGKSTLAIQLAIEAAAGRGSLGSAPFDAEGVPVFYCGLEDSDGAIQRHAFEISKANEIPLAALDLFRALGRSARDPSLARAIREGGLEATDFCRRLVVAVDSFQREVEDWPEAARARPGAGGLLVVDSASVTFDGDENQRRAVSQFLGMLTRIAERLDLTIIVIGHVSKAGLRDGSGQSGSTAWKNAARSAVLFDRLRDEGGAVVGDKDARVLKVTKSNFGPDGAEIVLRRVDGAFVLDTPPAAGEGGARGDAAEGRLIALIAKHDARGLPLSPHPNAAQYAAKIASAELGGKKREWAGVLDRLLTDGLVEIEKDGSKSRPRRVLRPAKIPPQGQ